MTPANDNTPTATPQRPASFDAMLMEYRPGLLKLAFKLGFKGEEREDLVTDTIIYCLRNWRAYRPTDSVWNYMYWAMRGVATAKKKSARNKLRCIPDPDGRIAAMMPTAANQEHHIDLGRVLNQITGRDGSVLWRRTMGDTLEDIGCDLGISRERVRQLEVRARERAKGALQMVGVAAVHAEAA